MSAPATAQTASQVQAAGSAAAVAAASPQHFIPAQSPERSPATQATGIETLTQLPTITLPSQLPSLSPPPYQGADALQLLDQCGVGTAVNFDGCGTAAFSTIGSSLLGLAAAPSGQDGLFTALVQDAVAAGDGAGGRYGAAATASAQAGDMV